MDDWSKKRKAWTDNRDKLGGKKGAAKGVSLGDEIDAVAKAAGKGYQSLAAALGKFLKATAKYKAGVGKGNDKVLAWIKTNLDGEAEATLKEIAADQKTLAWIEAEFITSINDYILGAAPDSGSLKNIRDVMAKKPDMSWADAAKAVKMFVIPDAIVGLSAKKVAGLGKVVWKVRLPGQDAAYKAIETYEKAYLADVKFFARWAKTQSLADFANFMKEHGQRNNSDVDFDAFKKAVKGLAA
jgi:hypothetical protein